MLNKHDMKPHEWALFHAKESLCTHSCKKGKEHFNLELHNMFTVDSLQTELQAYSNEIPDSVYSSIYHAIQNADIIANDIPMVVINIGDSNNE